MLFYFTFSARTSKESFAQMTRAFGFYFILAAYPTQAAFGTLKPWNLLQRSAIYYKVRGCVRTCTRERRGLKYQAALFARPFRTFNSTFFFFLVPEGRSPDQPVILDSGTRIQESGLVFILGSLLLAHYTRSTRPPTSVKTALAIVADTAS